VASGAEAYAAPGNVLDGFVRDIPGKETHQWSGRMISGGAWIELEWPAAVTFSQVQITFDTGFMRELTLSASDSVSNGVVRAAQPETVRDYRLEAGGRVLAEVKGNHQRLRKHSFAAVTTDRLRLHVTATNGSELARVFEIRCYA
jgi:hypothetical protein